LGAMSEKSSVQSKKYLKKLGVKVMTGVHVKDYDGKDVLLQDGSVITSSTVIWAAGVKGNIPAGVNKELIARGNRIITDRYNKLIGSENIYAIGDLAYMETPKYPHSHPQLANVAIEQAKLLAKNLSVIEKGAGTLKEYEYHDKGSMATVGRNLAVVDIPIPIAIGTKLHFGGFFAWLIWMGLHLMLILGVKNKFFVFINWFINYFTFDQSLRLIYKEFYKPKK